MELYKITTAVSVKENLTWDRVCDILAVSDDGDAWNAHEWLEERGEYPFLDAYGDQMILARM
jgi:hypothetical protein